MACIAQVWMSMRIPLWGDEMDTMAPAFRVWRGHQSFWWQIGQYNANPPGDNLVLRIYYRSDLLSWLRDLTPELYWRLPYILVFCATLCAAFLGAWRWTGSAFIAFLALAFSACSPGLLEYGNQIRFYIWLSFFITVLVWDFMRLAEAPSAGRLYRFSVIAALGVSFHLMIASIGYFLLGYTLLWSAGTLYNELFRKRRRLSARLVARLLTRIFFGALPFIIYKVALKHWVFIPHPWKELSPWTKFWNTGPTAAYAQHIASDLPYGGPTLIYTVSALLLVSAGVGVLQRSTARVAQGLLLFMLLAVTPVVLFVSGAARNYEVGGRHFVYEAPIFFCALVYLLPKPLFARLRGPFFRLAGAVIAVAVTWHFLISLHDFTIQRKNDSPGRVVYPFITWRTMYRNIPDARELVIVGSQPDRYTPVSDQGEYRAGIMDYYTREFSPLFYSTKGTYDKAGELAAQLAAKIESRPANYDFLLLDDAKASEKMFPRLPWKKWKCKAYTGSRPLSFCRI